MGTRTKIIIALLIIITLYVVYIKQNSYKTTIEHFDNQLYQIADIYNKGYITVDSIESDFIKNISGAQGISINRLKSGAITSEKFNNQLKLFEQKIQELETTHDNDIAQIKMSLNNITSSIDDTLTNQVKVKCNGNASISNYSHTCVGGYITKMGCTACDNA